jgi:hypothetical protein
MERSEKDVINYGWRGEDGDLMIVDYRFVCRSKRKEKQRRKGTVMDVGSVRID